MKIAFAEADGILTTTPPVLGATIVSENKSKSEKSTATNKFSLNFVIDSKY